MNPNLKKLQPYPFEKLHQLFSGISPDSSKAPISLAMGEPKHSPPAFVLEELAANLDKLSNYPGTKGILSLRQAIASWLENRFSLSSVDPETQVLPVNGTREALFAFAQTVVDASTGATVLSPNPFYQIYEGAALLAGASAEFINCGADTSFLPDFSSVTHEQWQQCQLLYLCSPGNPTGAVIPLDTLRQLIELAQEHDFVIASDECYSELYFDESKPPPGLLQACETMGNANYANCMVFHSLSKRSNLPGLRSGFVAGDSALIRRFLQYRTYHGCAMPLHHQLASIAAWNDENHVVANRALYTQKFSAVLDILSGTLNVSKPDAGFYLWPETPVSDTDFAQSLYEHEHVTVLPGQFLARQCAGINPGENRVRIALVAELEQCIEAAHRIVHHVEKLR
jgi:N-succinyldiaminopimelate aminotransferase